MQERIQKILSRAGVASRRGAEKVMTDGRVTVNGMTVRELGTKADVSQDDVRVDGVRLKPPKEPVYLLLNKPKGAVSTRHDPEGRTTVMDLVPPVAGLFPVGRLDVTTEGLLLLTNDGAFAEKVAHPRYEVARVYRAKVHRVPDAHTLERLRTGVAVEGQRMAVDKVRIVEADQNAWLELTLHEGRHHEVKRLLEAVGHPVSKLRRVALGPVTDKGLHPGEYRHLTPAEVRAFLHSRSVPRRGGRPRSTVTAGAASGRRRRTPAPARAGGSR
jgi:23S rRNA pseudouridine2605 synthase